MTRNGRPPQDMSLLRLQHEHITHDLWEGRERVLRPRIARVWILNNQDILDPRVINLMHQAGFGHAVYINHTIRYISPSESSDDEVIYNTFVVHLFIIHTYSCQ